MDRAFQWPHSLECCQFGVSRGFGSLQRNFRFQSDTRHEWFCFKPTFTVVSGTTYRIAVGGTPPTGSIGNVVLQLNPIVIFPNPLLTSDHFSFQATGPDTGTAIVETTVFLNPPNWQPVSTNPLVNGAFNFTDPRPMTNASLFYRVCEIQ